MIRPEFSRHFPGSQNIAVRKRHIHVPLLASLNKLTL